MRVQLEVSGHHAHVTSEDVKILFGPTHRLTPLRPISQPGQYAAKEKIRVRIAKFELEARVVGPARTRTQVEISLTEARRFGVAPPITYFDAPSRKAVVCTLIGPRGKVQRRAVIVAQRHIHCDPKTATRYGLRNGEKVSVRTLGGQRDATFHNVVVRVHPSFRFRCHLDTDEANAAGIRGGEWGTIIR